MADPHPSRAPLCLPFQLMSWAWQQLVGRFWNFRGSRSHYRSCPRSSYLHMEMFLTPWVTGLGGRTCLTLWFIVMSLRRWSSNGTRPLLGASPVVGHPGHLLSRFTKADSGLFRPLRAREGKCVEHDYVPGTMVFQCLLSPSPLTAFWVMCVVLKEQRVGV